MKKNRKHNSSTGTDKYLEVGPKKKLILVIKPTLQLQSNSRSNE